MGGAESSTESPPGYLVVGVLGRPVGLKGEVEVEVVTDDPSRFVPGSRLVVGGPARPLTLSSVRRHGERTIVAFEEVPDRTGAEALRGAELVVPMSAARALGPDEFWDHDLVGCEVVVTDGRDVGTVVDVLHSAANDVLVVRGGGDEHLLPLIRDVVRSVEPGRRITIDPMPGLLED
jgi:16S rRNA processing protein RimM